MGADKKRNHKKRSRNPKVEKVLISQPNNEGTLIRRDGRLYENELLYREGRHKPTLRGCLHLLCVLLLPYVVWRLTQQGRGSLYTMFVALLFSTTNVLLFVCSAIFHVGIWSHETEIMMQKLDHMACSLFAAGKMIPLAMLAFPKYPGMLLLCMLTVTCIWNFWNTINCKPSVIRQAMIPACLMPFIYPYCIDHMTFFEFYAMVLILVCQGIGALIFTYEYPNPFPNHFGYHEIFHIFVAIAGGLSIVASGSIIERSAAAFTGAN